MTAGGGTQELQQQHSTTERNWHTIVSNQLNYIVVENLFPNMHYLLRCCIEHVSTSSKGRWCDIIPFQTTNANYNAQTYEMLTSPGGGAGAGIRHTTSLRSPAVNVLSMSSGVNSGSYNESGGSSDGNDTDDYGSPSSNKNSKKSKSKKSKSQKGKGSKNKKKKNNSKSTKSKKKNKSKSKNKSKTKGKSSDNDSGSANSSRRQSTQSSTQAIARKSKKKNKRNNSKISRHHKNGGSGQGSVTSIHQLVSSDQIHDVLTQMQASASQPNLYSPQSSLKQAYPFQNSNQNSNSPQGAMVNYMSGSMSNLHAFASSSKLKTLVYNPNEETTIIKDKYQLESDVIYSFENLKLIKGALLTVSEYNSETNQNGGILRIKCTNLTLEDGAKITVNGKGYKGGKNMWYQGESYQGIAKESRLNNYGGGGGGAVGVVGAGGGGYGTNGMNGSNNGGRGGIAYGDAQLTVLHLGSGGGYGPGWSGSNGGGAIVIECKNSIIIDKGCSITANGQNKKKDEYNYYSGCGSGGSIYLVSNKIVNKGKIMAIGGANKYGLNGFGCGGMGRIRIDCKKENYKYIEKSTIEPQVGYIQFI